MLGAVHKLRTRQGGLTVCALCVRGEGGGRKYTPYEPCVRESVEIVYAFIIIPVPVMSGPDYIAVVAPAAYDVCLRR